MNYTDALRSNFPAITKVETTMIPTIDVSTLKREVNKLANMNRAIETMTESERHELRDQILHIQTITNVIKSECESKLY
jgi:uncharacterized protein YaaN involved in tellurite resistance